MQPLRYSLSAALAAGLLGLAAACHADESAPADDRIDIPEPPELGLFGTIPIYWGESGDFGELVAGGAEPHWARAQLEERYRLRPLDQLSDESLAGLNFLLLAQPRALGPAENVALDTWVRKGGYLLLFADPMLTGESRFPVGDRRRPQDVVLLSPILRRWGLELQFDDERPEGFEVIPAYGAAIPVNRPGTFAPMTVASGCEDMAAHMLARCPVGAGQVVVLADAAMLDLHDPNEAAAPALEWLLINSFPESMGNRGPR
jgi:hypothetical protein